MCLPCSISWTDRRKVDKPMAKLSRRYQRDRLPNGKQIRLKTDDTKLPTALRRSREQHAKEKKHAENGREKED